MAHTWAAAALLLVLLQGAAAYDNGAPHARLPPMGWSSWVALGPGAEHPIFDFCDDASIRAAADALVSDELGLYDAGYVHFHLGESRATEEWCSGGDHGAAVPAGCRRVLLRCLTLTLPRADDCWAGGRNETGYVYPEKDHFPVGMKPVVDYVHSKGLAFGLYTCAGTQTCVGGRPGSKDHWEQDAAVYAEWGVDWVKMDWVSRGPSLGLRGGACATHTVALGCCAPVQHGRHGAQVDVPADEQGAQRNRPPDEPRKCVGARARRFHPPSVAARNACADAAP